MAGIFALEFAQQCGPHKRTTQAAREIAAAVRVEPEVTNYQVYAGVSSPFNFNGLVRHYFMRGGANVADIQVNLVGKNERKAKSHDIAKRVRPRVAAIAEKYGARVAVAEVPPTRRISSPPSAGPWTIRSL